MEYTNYTLEECIRRGVEAFDWKKRWRPKPGSDAGPVKRGAGLSFMAFRSGVGRSSAVIQLDGNGQYRVHVGVTDVGGGAKTTMGIIAAEALDVPLSQVKVVWGDTSGCPYSVGESGSRTTILTGYAVIEAARDLKRQIAEKGMPKGSDLLTASANPNPTVEGGKVRATFGAHFVEVEVDTETGPRSRAEISGGARLRTHHESACRPPARSRAARRWASAWRCMKNCCTTRAAARR